MTDSTIVFPACGFIRTRIDTKEGNVWLEGYPGWSRPCFALFSLIKLLESDSSYYDSVPIDSTGRFRIVTIYGMLSGSYEDTLFSNEFLVLNY